MESTTIPIYRQSLMWDQLYREYPVPDVFIESTYLLDRSRMLNIQQKRAVAAIKRASEVPFYQNLWRSAGVDYRAINSLDDLQKLPTFTSEDIRADQEAHPPFGSIQGIARRSLGAFPIKVQTSGGTSGKPRITLNGPIEWEMLALTYARGLYLEGGRPGDVVQIPMTAALSNFGWTVYKAAHDYLGMVPLTTGSGLVTPSRRQLELAFQWKTDIWVSFPEYLMQLAEVARVELETDVRELDTKLIATCLGADIKGLLRKRLEDLWGCPVYDGYGTHEIGGAAFECKARAGLHLMEDCLYMEVLDVDHGTPVASGEVGNLVVTAFFRELLPLVRYNLQDLGRIVSNERCSCGSSFRRMDHFLGRSDEMVKIRGTNIHPMACLSAIQSDSRTTGEWLCILRRVAGGATIGEELIVLVEVRNGSADLPGLLKKVARRLRDDLGMRVPTALVQEGSLVKLVNVGREGKARRILDLRDDSIQAVIPGATILIADDRFE